MRADDDNCGENKIRSNLGYPQGFPLSIPPLCVGVSSVCLSVFVCLLGVASCSLSSTLSNQEPTTYDPMFLSVLKVCHSSHLQSVFIFIACFHPDHLTPALLKTLLTFLLRQPLTCFPPPAPSASLCPAPSNSN